MISQSHKNNMNQIKQKIAAVILALAIMSGLVSFAFANTTTNATSSPQATSTRRGEMRAQIKAEVEANALVRVKERANNELDRRIAELNKVAARINSMKKLSATDKTTLTAQVQAQITLLNNLKIKINADTDIAVLKTDTQSITASYRIFALIVPKIHILAAADRANSIVDLLTTDAGKLQTRITELKTAGKNTATLEVSLADMNAKIADAKIQIKAAIDLVTPLTPDNGDKAKAEANRAALKGARGKLQAAHQDFVTVKKDFEDIRKGLKDLGVKINSEGEIKVKKGTTTSATSTATTTATTTP
jgi:hypothetical protein